MHHAARTLCVALAALLTSTRSVSAQSHKREIDALLADYALPDRPGASVLVMQRGRVVYAHGYGVADIDNRIAVTANTNFRLASLSKQFTATAVMLLVRDRKLRYDDSITKLLPDLPAFAAGVTVRNLLNHTSGLPDYEDFVPDTQTTQVHDADVPGLIANASSMKFAPGSKYDYSNTGYALLALIVERVSGKRYADFLRARIFRPLGMKETVAFEDGRSVVAHRAFGHRVDSAGHVRRTDQSNTSAVLGDGGIYSSATDLAKWHRAMDRHALVSATQQQLAWTSPQLTDGTMSGYGFGWFVDRDRGMLRVRHHGETRGFTNGVVKYPEKDLTVVVLTNRSGGRPWDIAQRVAELFLGASSEGPSPSWRP